MPTDRMHWRGKLLKFVSSNGPGDVKSSSGRIGFAEEMLFGLMPGVGQIARLPVDLPGDPRVSMEWGLEPQARFELLLWLAPSSTATRAVEAGGFWTDWSMGQPMWLRFAFRTKLLNSAVFAAAEARPALDPAQRPQGVWLPR